jgi:molecular chaperone GrpE
MVEESKDIIIENQSKILDELMSLKKDFQSKIKYDEQKEITITKLHDELQLYKRDLYKKMLLPVINDLIHFSDRTEKDLEFLVDVPAEKLMERIHDFLDDLRDVLYRQGVEPYKLENDDFDPKKQKIIKTIETNDKELDKKVANHKFYGYEWEEKIIKPESVEVYVYKEDVGGIHELPLQTPIEENYETNSVGEDTPIYPETKEEDNV